MNECDYGVNIPWDEVSEEDKAFMRESTTDGEETTTEESESSDTHTLCFVASWLVAWLVWD